MKSTILIISVALLVTACGKGSDPAPAQPAAPVQQQQQPVNTTPAPVPVTPPPDPILTTLPGNWSTGCKGSQQLDFSFTTDHVTTKITYFSDRCATQTSQVSYIYHFTATDSRAQTPYASPYGGYPAGGYGYMGAGLFPIPVIFQTTLESVQLSLPQKAIDAIHQGNVAYCGFGPNDWQPNAPREVNNLSCNGSQMPAAGVKDVQQLTLISAKVVQIWGYSAVKE